MMKLKSEGRKGGRDEKDGIVTVGESLYTCCTLNNIEGSNVLYILGRKWLKKTITRSSQEMK